MHSTDALPLPPRPDIAQYKKLAKELLAEAGSGQAPRIQAWFDRWFTRLHELSLSEMSQPRRPDWIAHRAGEMAEYWSGAREIRGIPPARATLAHAQFILARLHGFASWAALTRHIEMLRRGDSEVARFEAAVDALVSGDDDALRILLRDHPELIRQRSSRAHGCTLLHYVSANGVEGYRQKTPSNILAVARLLLQKGADVNATAHCYGPEDDVLGLTATSAHPQNAGVMIPLLEILVAAGAPVDRDGRIVHACIANGQPDAGRWLVDHGAACGLPEAAGLGRLDLVKSFVAPDGTLLQGATAQQLEEAFRNASWYGEDEVVRYLLDAGFEVAMRFKDGTTALHHACYDGSVAVVEALLARGIPLNIREPRWNGNALDWALWAWGADRRTTKDPDAYYKVIALLRRAGEDVKQSWYENDDGKAVMERVQADPRMQAALRGEG